MTRRRGNHEGTIYKRKDGRYEAAITIGGGRTRQQRKRVYGRTREEAAKKLQDIQHQARTGTLRVDERVTMAQFSGQWLEEKRLTVKDSTWRYYELVMRVHVLPAIGQVRLSKLSTAHIQDLYTRMTSSGLSPVSVKDYAARLHACLERAVELDLLLKNPAKAARLPKRPKRDMVMLKAEQVKTLIQAAASDRLEGLLTLSLAVGLRQGEALALQWDRVELDQSPGSILITKTLQPTPGGNFSLEEPKTPSSVRRVELPRQAVEALKRHRTVQNKERLAAKVWLNDRNLVFVTEVGTPIHKSNLMRRSFRPWLKKAGLQSSMRWHDLRHVAASLMLSKGVPITVVAATLGHADVAITLSTYAWAIPGQQTLAREAMEELLA